MRVLLVANTLPPRDLSGVGEQVLQLARGLRGRGHEVEILGRGRRGLAASKLLFPLTVLPRLRRRLDELRPDVVQVHESDGALAAVVVRRWRRRHHAATHLLALLQVSYLEEQRAVRALRGCAPPTPRPTPSELRFRWLRAPIHVLLGRRLARWADRVLAPSSRTATELQRDYGAGHVEVLPNVSGGVVGDVTSSRLEDLPSRYLLYVGRLRIRKGVEVLLEAIARLARSVPDAELLIAGDGERTEIVRRRIQELGLTGRVHMLGRQDPAAVRQLLSAAQALVVPSIYEGMPLVILEAMEAARPVVATTVAGIPEVVDEETGWLVPPEDPAALAAALREVWRDPAEAERRGAAGRRRLDARYRPEHGAERWEEIVAGLGDERLEA